MLVAGIGNIFMADDGFGVEVARRLLDRPIPAGVDVKDFGIRGMDLVFALGEDYDVAVFVDAVPKGEEPGTLFVIEPDLDDEEVEVTLDAHGMDPVKVLALARTLGSGLPRTLVLGCEPAAAEEFTGLSAPVEAALGAAEKLLEEVLRKERS